MLILQRSLNQKIFIGHKDNPQEITLIVTFVRGNTVKIGIEAPKEYVIVREELLNQNKESDNGSSS